MQKPSKLPSPPGSDLYEAYCRLNGHLDEQGLSRFAALVTPQIERAAARLYPVVQGLDRDALVNDALAHVLTVAVAGRLLSDSVAQFRGYLRTTITNAVHSALRGAALTTTDQLPEDASEGPTPSDVAAAIEVLQGLPDRIAEACVSRNRYPELPDVLVRYIVRCLLTGEPVSSTVVGKYGGLESPGWYVGYVDVLVRWALYETKDELSGCRAPR